MRYSIHLTNEEKEYVESYAKAHSMSVSEAFKQALFEKIENEHDTAIADEAYKEYIESNRKSRPIAELLKELEL